MSLTHFPVKGGNEEVSLKHTQYKVWTDFGYLEELRQNWPEIWAKGGNILGNTQYSRLLPVVGRDSGKPASPEEEKAIRLREAWAARHYGKGKLAGVVAQLKWFVVGRKGSACMRQVIEAEKTRIRERRKAMEAEENAGGTMEVLHDLVKAILNAAGPLDLVCLLVEGAAEIAALDPENADLAALLPDLEALREKLMPQEEPEAPTEEEPAPEPEAPIDPTGEPEAAPPTEEEPEAQKSWMAAWERPQLALKKGDVAVRSVGLQIGQIQESGKRLMVATSADEDRYKDIVDIKTIIVKEWQRNPILLFGHNPAEPQNLVGQARNIQVKTVKGSDGKQREAVVYEPEFDRGGKPGVDDNPRAKLVARQYEEGLLKTCSIGFVPDWTQSVMRSSLPKDDPYWGERGILYKGATIIECSILPIPANPAAESVANKGGNEKDWMNSWS